MLQGEMWIKRLGVEAAVELETSLALWQAFVHQVELRLSDGQVLNLEGLGRWFLNQREEFVALNAGLSYLVPPMMRLDIVPSSPTVLGLALEGLAPSLCYSTQVQEQATLRWLRAIPTLTISLLEAGHQVLWQGLGQWQIEGTTLSFTLDEELATRLNKPFEVFRIEPLRDLSPYQGLEHREVDIATIKAPQVLRLDIQQAPNKELDQPSVEGEVPIPLPSVEVEVQGDEPINVAEDQPIVVQDKALVQNSKDGRTAVLIILIIVATIAVALSMLWCARDRQVDTPRVVGGHTAVAHEKPSVDKQTTIPIDTQRRADTITEPKSTNERRREDSTHKASCVESNPRATPAKAREDKEEVQGTRHKPKATTGVATKSREDKRELAESIELQADQSLALIAERKYGHRAFWVYIYEENRERIPDPHHIAIGTRLHLPPASKYGIDARNTKSLRQALLLSRSL